MANSNVAIMYVGKKLRKVDNVANSGTIWNGMGDVQTVTEEVAQRLLQYPLVWQRAMTGKDAVPGLQSSADKFGDMDKDELYGYAVEKLNLILDRRRPLGTLREQVRKALSLKEAITADEQAAQAGAADDEGRRGNTAEE